MANQSDGTLCILNIGTKILLKDTMDHFLRTLGNFKTFYAPTLQSALRTFQDNTVHIIITEVDLTDGSAYRLVKELGGGAAAEGDLYIILATEERSEPFVALAEELEVQSILVKPFNAADLKILIERFITWRKTPKEPWQLLVREAQMAARDKKYRTAEEHFVEAIRIDPNNPIPIYKAGAYYLGKPDYVNAEKFLKKAIDMKPDYTLALSALGSLYLAKKDLENAESFFLQAQLASPLNPDRSAQLGRFYLERCLSSFQQALRIDPSSNAVRIALAKLLSVQKDYVGCVQQFEKILTSLQEKEKVEALTYIALARKLGGLAK